MVKPEKRFTVTKETKRKLSKDMKALSVPRILVLIDTAAREDS